jgi:hypothetical protein
VQFLKLEHAKVGSDLPHLQLDDAIVIANGDSVIVSAYVDVEEGQRPVRPVRVDRLTKADVKSTRGGTFAFSGTSEWLLEQVGVTREQAITTIRVNKWKGCEGCD